MKVKKVLVKCVLFGNLPDECTGRNAGMKFRFPI